MLKIATYKLNPLFLSLLKKSCIIFTSKPRQINRISHFIDYSNCEKNVQSSSTVITKLIYIQNPWHWMRNKLLFYYLKLSWDPNFLKNEFERGAKQVSHIHTTEI